ncbi:hypothetical protein Lal_00030150 [Lupinus albus]|nr:hypothetical protein Lal_00030150 [Lupinus albus]
MLMIVVVRRNNLNLVKIGNKLKTCSRGRGLVLKPPSTIIKEGANQAIATCFYNNVIPFNMARSDEYFEMFELVAKHGIGFNPPSYYETRIKYLKEEVKLTNARLEEQKVEWKKVGCTIMTDDWTDKRRMIILNFLVHSPRGTFFLKSIDAYHIAKTTDRIFKMIDEVVEEIEEDNVVQVVTSIQL